MVAKVLLHKFIRLKKLLLFLLVSVLILFYVCLTDNMVFMQGYTTRKAELQASLTNPSFKPSRSLGHASTNDESKKMAGKLPLHKMKESTRKVHFNEQLNGQDNTLQNTEGQYPTDLKTSNNHQQKLELHINSNDQRNSVNLIGKVKDKRLIPDDGKLTTIQAIHKRCLGCKKPENAGYYGTDLMALPKYNFDPTYKNPCWKENGTLRCLPYFYIIGVKKAGTSELWRHISTHPEFAIPNFGKEAQWFARGRFNKRYCDASPSNLHLNSHWRYLPGNGNLEEPKYVILDYIHHFLPRAKIIIIFRDPVDRLYSEYYHQFGRLRRRFRTSPKHFHNIVVSGLRQYKECLKHRTLRSCVYDESIYSETGINFQLGIYHVYWQELIRLFPKEQILVIQNIELRHMKRTMEKVFTFLDMRSVLNVQWHGTNRHANVRRPVDAEKGDMLNQTRKLLEDFYRPFNEEMCRLTGDTSFLYKHTT